MMKKIVTTVKDYVIHAQKPIFVQVAAQMHFSLSTVNASAVMYNIMMIRSKFARIVLIFALNVKVLTTLIAQKKHAKLQD